MKKLFKWTIACCLLGVLGVLLHLNVALYYQPTIIWQNSQAVNKDVLRQLTFLKKYLKAGGGKEMQRIFPEGFVFMHALYGMAWYETAKSLTPHSPVLQQAVQEIDWVLTQLHSKEAKSPFEQDLPVSYGVFYTGWRNLLLARKLSLLPAEKRNSAEVAAFKATCDQIVQALPGNRTPYLESYAGAAWPADMVVGMTSVAIHDRLFPPKYQSVLTSWLEAVKARLDPVTGLIPHAVQAGNGLPLAGARGSSQSLILSFLPEIDTAFASGQFVQYQKFFLAYRLGLPGIREYPKGREGEEDIDSGPVIWGIGGAASIVGIKAMEKFGQHAIAQGLRNSVEGFGLPYTHREQKKYLFGAMPMADAFIAWTHAGFPVSGDRIPGEVSAPREARKNWRKSFQVYSLIAGFFVLLLLIFLWKSKSPSLFSNGFSSNRAVWK